MLVICRPQFPLLYQCMGEESQRLEKIELHELSQLHVGACVMYDQWKLHGTIDAQLERDVRNMTLFWRQVLECIVNVALTQANCSLVFSGHRDILGRPNIGNFLASIELLANYDPVLQEPFECLSPSIQNELIYISFVTESSTGRYS